MKMKRKTIRNIIAIILIIFYLLYSVYFKQNTNIEYYFRSENQLVEHYEKHGIDMGFSNKEDYLSAANNVINNSESLHKIEKEDNDDIYYLVETNEIVFVAKDGYIRTYFSPSNGIEYFERQ